MISIDKALPLPNLSSLNSSQIAIKVNPEGGFFAYLDFFQSHTLDHKDVKSGIDRLTQNFPKQTSVFLVGSVFLDMNSLHLISA